MADAIDLLMDWAPALELALQVVAFMFLMAVLAVSGILAFLRRLASRRRLKGSASLQRVTGRFADDGESVLDEWLSHHPKVGRLFERVATWGEAAFWLLSAMVAWRASDWLQLGLLSLSLVGLAAVFVLIAAHAGWRSIQRLRRPSDTGPIVS